jgi:hypothetical protein
MVSPVSGYIRALKGFLQPSRENTNAHLVLSSSKWFLWSQPIPWSLNYKRCCFTRAKKKYEWLAFLVSLTSVGIPANLATHWFYENVITKSEQERPMIWKQVMMTYFTIIQWILLAGCLCITSRLIDLIPLLNFLLREETRGYLKGINLLKKMYR